MEVKTEVLLQIIGQKEVLINQLNVTILNLQKELATLKENKTE